MGQATVRNAVYTALTSTTFPYVGTVWPARAYISETDYEVNAAGFYTSSVNGSGCVIVVNLPGPDRRYRIDLTGRGTVSDFNVHPIMLELFFANVSGNPVTAQEEYDQIIDAIIPFIRANPTLLDSNVVWSAGEEGDGIVHEATPPYTMPTSPTVLINGRVNFEVWEQIIGQGV